MSTVVTHGGASNTSTSAGRARSARAPASLWAALIGAAAALGILCANLAAGNVPAAALLSPLLLLPIAVWKNPRIGIYLVFAAVLSVEQFGYEVGPRTGAATAAIPLFHGILPGGMNPTEALIALTGVVVVMKAAKERSKWLHRSPLAGLLLAMAVLVVAFLLVGVSRGGDTTMALWEIRAFLYLLAMFLLASALMDRIEHVRPLLWILIVVSAAKAAYGLTIFWDIRGVEPRPEAVLAHEESFFFGLYIMAVVALWLFGIRSRMRLVATLLIPVVLAADMVNSRRTAWLILMLGVAVLFVVALVRMRERRKALTVLLLATGVGVAIYLPAFWSSDSTIAQPARAVRSAVAPDARDQASNDYRTVENFNVMVAISDSGSRGTGYGQPLTYVGLVDLTESNPLLRFVPHNTLLHVWLRTGIIGVLVWSVVLARAIISSARLSAANSREVGSFGAIATAALFGFVAMGVTDMGFFWFRNSLALGILLGTVAALSRTYLRTDDSNQLTESVPMPARGPGRPT